MKLRRNPAVLWSGWFGIMSVEIRAKIICDGCGAAIEGKLQNRTTWGFESYWDAKKEAQRRRWLINTRYGTAKHYCQKCADGTEIALNLSKTGGVVG